MNYQEYTGEWPWKDFGKHEIACYGYSDANVKKHGKVCGCGEELWSPDLGDEMPEDTRAGLDFIQALRDLVDGPISFSSVHRCIFHNGRSGGGKTSQHLGIAFDVRCPRKKQKKLVRLARKLGVKGVGWYKTFLHFDFGRKRSWGKRP